MKVVVLDGYTLNPGDLSWESLKKTCDLEIFDKTDPEQIIERVKNADGILTNKVAISKEIIEQLPHLKYIGVLATGYNIVDVDFAKKNRICVTNIPSYSTDSVAQLVFAFIFNFYWHIKEHSDEVIAGKWSQCEHFCYHSFPIYELCNKTLGIIGYGNIGQAVAKIALSMNMKVIYFNRTKKIIKGLEVATQKDLETLLKESDIISLNTPLNEETRHIINGKSINLIKKTAYLINTGRGPLVDESVLTDALKNKKIAGFAGDVMSVEPPHKNNALFNAPNCIITPHIAWQTYEARTRLLDIAVNNIKAFSSGNPINLV